VNPGENNRGEIVDRELSKLNHEAKDAGKRPAFGAAEPGRVHLDHAGRAERLEVAVNQPDEGKGGEGADERSEAVNQVDADRPCGTDQHRLLAADAIREKAVDELACAVGQSPRAEHACDLEFAEPKLLHHPGCGLAEVVAAGVRGRVEKSDQEPVQSAPWAEAGRILVRDFAHESGSGRDDPQGERRPRVAPPARWAISTARGHLHDFEAIVFVQRFRRPVAPAQRGSVALHQRRRERKPVALNQLINRARVTAINLLAIQKNLHFATRT
jgi:hypothetical protein